MESLSRNNSYNFCKSLPWYQKHTKGRKPEFRFYRDSSHFSNVVCRAASLAIQNARSGTQYPKILMNPRNIKMITTIKCCTMMEYGETFYDSLYDDVLK